MNSERPNRHKGEGGWEAVRTSRQTATAEDENDEKKTLIRACEWQSLRGGGEKENAGLSIEAKNAKQAQKYAGILRFGLKKKRRV